MSDGIDPRKYAAAVAEATRRKDQIERLTAELEAAKAQNAELAQQLNEAVDILGEFEAALEEAQQQVPADEKDQRIAELERTIKERDLREQFNQQAEGKIRKDALDAAWKLSGLNPDVELAENGLGEAIDALVKGHGFLAPTPEPKSDPAVTGGRGTDVSGKPSVQPTSPGPGIARGSMNASTTSPESNPAMAKAQAYLDKTGRVGNPYRIA